MGLVPLALPILVIILFSYNPSPELHNVDHSLVYVSSYLYSIKALFTVLLHNNLVHGVDQISPS